MEKINTSWHYNCQRNFKQISVESLKMYSCYKKNSAQNKENLMHIQIIG